MILLSRKGARPRRAASSAPCMPSRFLPCSRAHASHKVPTCSTRLRSRSLSELLKEAEQNNPQIQAGRQGTQAARQVPAQVTALPDPMFQIQQVNVGSPRPFAGYTNSEFAYIGLGASQDIPYPGKLRLRGEIAQARGRHRRQPRRFGLAGRARRNQNRILPARISLADAFHPGE